MGYELEAFLSREKQPQKWGEAFSDGFTFPLTDELTLIPLTEDLQDRLKEGIDHWGAKISQQTDVAYLSSFLHGGSGHALAKVWSKGSLVLEADALSPAIKYFGVVKGEHHDEFDAVGLGRFRNTYDWVGYGYVEAALKGAEDELSVLCQILQKTFPDHSSAEHIREVVGERLQALGPQATSAIPVLESAILQGERSPGAHELLLALGSMGEPAVPALIRLIENPILKWNRWAAFRALQEIGPRAKAAVPTLEKQLKGDESSGAKEALAAILKDG